MNFFNSQTRFRPLRLALAGLIAVSALAACGGDDDPPKYSRMVSFGDSLSDVGTYATAGVRSIGGGKYTVNSPTAKIWVELLAERAGLPAPCAAQTGLESSGPLAGLAQTVANNSACFAYSQGGSRVTNPVGPGNKALLAAGDAGGALGQLTVPLVTQVANHLRGANNRFASDELITVFAGGNDFFMNFAAFNAAVTGGGAFAAAGNSAVTGMSTAGGELATLVRNSIVSNGGNRVVVVTLPDLTKTPFGAGIVAASGANGPQISGLMQQMATGFNNQLASGLTGVPGVLVVDGYGFSQSVAANPSGFGLTNVTTPVCSAAAQLGSLSCTASTLVTGAAVDTSQYADSVHPTPAGHRLIFQSVLDRMLNAGWL
jgi:outer membrane lipase/esterase